MIGWQSDLELVCRDDRNVRCKDLNLENVIELSEWYLVVRGLQNEVAKQTPVNRDTEKFSSGPHHPPGYKEGERMPRCQEAWGEGDEVNACGILKGILREATTGVLGETLGFHSWG